MTSISSYSQHAILGKVALNFGEVEGSKASSSRLIQFLGSTYHVLNQLSKSGCDHRGELLLFERLHTQILVAWQDMPRHFQELAAAIEQMTEERLEAKGLTQRRLDNDLKNVAHCWNIFVTTGGRDRARDMLVGINDIYRPIIDATGVAGALKDYVDKLIGCLVR